MEFGEVVPESANSLTTEALGVRKAVDQSMEGNETIHHEYRESHLLGEQKEVFDDPNDEDLANDPIASGQMRAQALSLFEQVPPIEIKEIFHPDSLIPLTEMLHPDDMEPFQLSSLDGYVQLTKSGRFRMQHRKLNGLLQIWKNLDEIGLARPLRKTVNVKASGEGTDSESRCIGTDSTLWSALKFR